MFAEPCPCPCGCGKYLMGPVGTRFRHVCLEKEEALRVVHLLETGEEPDPSMTMDARDMVLRIQSERRVLDLRVRYGVGPFLNGEWQ